VSLETQKQKKSTLIFAVANFSFHFSLSLFQLIKTNGSAAETTTAAINEKKKKKKSRKKINPA